MAKDSDDFKLSPNGNKPPDSIHFERSAVKCQRCGRVFANFLIEEIDDLAQLRCGDVLIAKTTMMCLNCGWVFHWDVNGRKLEEMAVTYKEIIVKIGAYRPE